MFRFIQPRNRIALGLTGAVVAVICVARVAGYLPNEESLEIKSRANLSETIAMGSSAVLIGGDTGALESYLAGVVSRNKNLLSAGVRDEHAFLMVCINDHDQAWQPLGPNESTDSQMQVPLYKSAVERWGTVELRFQSLQEPGLIGMAKSMGAEQMFFIGSSCFLLFSFLLGMVLKHLDPSKAVPQRVRDALDNLAEGLMILDTKYNILLANTAFSTVVGEKSEKLVGRNAKKLNFCFSVDGEDDQVAPWRVALAEQRPVSNSRIRLVDCENVERIYLVNCSPLLGHHGNYAGVMVTFDDVTKLEESRLQLREARDAADAANQAKSEFLANMSHEIRTPMNAILGFTDVLRRGMEENPDQRIEYLNTIHSSGNHLIELINDILDLSKVEAGKLELELREFSLPQLLQDTINVLSARASQRQIALEFEIEGSIPDRVTSDSTRIKQVLINLIGNAIKFTEQGGVMVTCSFSGDTIRMDVSDTGIGMSPEQLERIFDPFSQADSSMTRRFGGTGLGLSICKRFVEALGGSISVTSEFGKGSTFTLQTPIAVCEDSELVDQQQCLELIKTTSKQGVTDQGNRLNPATILVVDDGETNRNLVSVVLKRHGIQVVEAENGQLGVDAAMQQDFDVILMDMQMPVMDGYTATATLREMGVATPIFALTGNAMQGEKQRCLDAGCDSYLPKPIEIDCLIELLGSYIGFSDIPMINNIEKQPVAAVAGGTGNDPSDEITELPASSDSDEDMSQIQPWNSTLPMDDPDFRLIVEKFVDGLPEKLHAMIGALEEGDLNELGDLGHWLKGAGGTVGLGRLTEPSRQLEMAARSDDVTVCRDKLEYIVALCSAIDLESVPV